ncbi:MAG: PilZ domain-containing protein [Planctomycetes bacterium]|nr:PilZ domain-containing protein [Planctomycetota bacterium]
MNDPESDLERTLSGLDVDERRKHPRYSSHARVTMRLDGAEQAGVAENLSAGGVPFFTDGDLRVTLVIEEHGERTEHSGRLVRAQRMRGSRLGWAIEFDPS